MYLCIVRITSLHLFLFSFPSVECRVLIWIFIHIFIDLSFVLCYPFAGYRQVSLANHTHVELNWHCHCKSVCSSFWSLSHVVPNFSVSRFFGHVCVRVCHQRMLQFLLSILLAATWKPYRKVFLLLMGATVKCRYIFSVKKSSNHFWPEILDKLYYLLI